MESPEELKDQQITAGQLALEVMHEVRNPLEALGHLTYLTCHSASDPDKVAAYMRMAEEQIATLNRIVSQTLGYARNQSQRTRGDLVEVAEAALRIHQRTIEAKKIHLLKDLPTSVTAEIRKGEILQVVSNLIMNALDALPAKGILAVRLQRRDGGIFFLISDNGHGIPVQNFRKVFEPFFTTKGQYGTGLGLALTKRIIEGHGGKIWVRSSVRPGKSGTTFRISLPA